MVFVFFFAFIFSILQHYSVEFTSFCVSICGTYVKRCVCGTLSTDMLQIQHYILFYSIFVASIALTLDAPAVSYS